MRYDVNHLRGVPVIPMEVSRDIIMLWSRVSNAEEISSNVRIEPSLCEDDK